MQAERSSRQEEEVNELHQPRWSVVSFDRCEASGLIYQAAAEKLAELEAASVTGLCIVTDEAAKRMCGNRS
jgi:hypothetical protein